jgi:hypothetical protein
LGDGESITAGLDGLLEPDGCESIQSNVKSEADSIKTGNQKNDRRDCDFKRLEANCYLNIR